MLINDLFINIYMNMIKNLFKYCIITSIVVWFISSSCFWALNDLRGSRWSWAYGELEEDFSYEDGSTKILDCEGNTDLGNCTGVKEKDDTIVVKLLKVFGLDYSTEKERDLKFIDYARAILNMALGLLAFIALIMTIYTFYMMFFTEDEAWAKKAKESLIGIFIALGIIWLAWLIVSFIFWRYQSNWKEKQEDIRKMGQWDTAMVTDTTIYDQIYLTT